MKFLKNHKTLFENHAHQFLGGSLQDQKKLSYKFSKKVVAGMISNFVLFAGIISLNYMNDAVNYFCDKKPIISYKHSGRKNLAEKTYSNPDFKQTVNGVNLLNHLDYEEGFVENED